MATLLLNMAPDMKDMVFLLLFFLTKTIKKKKTLWKTKTGRKPYTGKCVRILSNANCIVGEGASPKPVAVLSCPKILSDT